MSAGSPMGPQPFRGAGRQGPPAPSFLLNQFDKNKDDKLTKSELPGFIWDRLSKADKNGDGEVSKDEIETHMKTIRPDGTSKPEDRRSEDKSAPEAAKDAKSA